MRLLDLYPNCCIKVNHSHRTFMLFLSILLACIPQLSLAASYMSNNNVKIGTIDFPGLSSLNDESSQNTVTYANQFFSTVPSLLFGITDIELEIQNLTNVNFQLIPSDNDVKGFTLTLSKVGAVKIDKLSVCYFSSVYLNLITLREDFDFHSNIESIVGEKVTASKTFSYQVASTANQTRKVQAFITGLEREFSNASSPDNKFSIFLNVIMSGSDFKIEFVCNDINYSAANQIKRVSFNYIEFVEDNIDQYARAVMKSDLSYKTITNEEIGKTSSTKRTVQHWIQGFLYLNQNANVFNGLFGVQSSSSSDFLRMKIEKATIQSYDILFRYSTYGSTVIEGVTAGLFQFEMINCATISATPYFFDENQQCIDNCPTSYSLQKLPGDTRNQCVQCASNCLTCYGAADNNCITCQPTFQYFLDDKCSADQPNSSYCDPVSFQCLSCTISDCSRCDPTLRVCKVCSATYYFYNHACHLPPPDKTYCDNKKMECMDCKAECKSCATGITCDSCEPGRKFYKNQCPVVCPTTTYSDANDICQKCPSECTSCINPTDCQSCTFGYYLYKSFCYKVLPPHTYCDTSLNCYDCGPLCNTCSFQQTKCDSCYSQAPYLFEKNCYQSQPQGSGCPKDADGLNYICSACPSKCATCNEKLQCLQCSAGYPYFYHQDCFSSQPLGTYCDLTTKACSNCTSACASCVGGTAKDCIDCAAGFIQVTRTDGTRECVCGDKFKRYDQQLETCVWKDGGFSADTITRISDALKGVSYSSSGFSFFFAVASSFTKSGISLVSNMLMIQKIFYMRVANVDKPLFLVQFFKSLDDGGIISISNQVNIFKGIDSDAATPRQPSSTAAVALAASNQSNISSHLNTLSESNNSERSSGELLMDYGFGDAGLSAAIFVNIGGVLVLMFLIFLVQLVFAFIVKNDISSNAFYVYAMFICGPMVQMLPLITFVLFNSFFMELTQISAVIDYYGVFGGVFLLLMIAATMLFIFISLGLVFAKGTTVNSNSREPTSVQESSGFSMKLLMREVEMNLKRDTIQNKMIQRNYLIVFYAIECVVFPLITIMLRSSFYAVGIIGIVLQASLFVFTVVVRPFYIKLINVQFALEQLFMLVSYIVYLCLAFALDVMSVEEEEIPKGIITLSFICLAFAVLAIIVNPIMQVILLVQVLKSTYFKETFMGRFTNQEISLFATVELIRKQNIEFPNRGQASSSSTFFN